MTSSLGARAPKYHRVADELRTKISQGEYQPGEQLPTEATLVEQYRVSMPTIRAALSVLRAEGLIESMHGVGTFVKKQERLERRSRDRYGRARADRQLLTSHFRHEITSAGREPAPPEVAKAMAIEPGQEVVVRRRNLYDPQTGRPEEIGVSYVPVDIAGNTYLEDRKVVPKALFLCVEELSGKRYTYAHDRWTARLPTAEEAALLNLPSGAPVMHVFHVATAADHSVLEVSESTWPADRIMIVDDYRIEAKPAKPKRPSDI